MANMWVGVDQSSIDTPRSAGTSESSRFGEEDAPPTTEGERILTVALKEFLRMEVRVASIDAERPYVRGPNRRPFCPMRQFAERRRLRAIYRKITTQTKRPGLLLQGRPDRLSLSLTETS